ncbi:hypothetical protein IJ21_17510 [Paenibacillus sp. 32O-W]|uniref:DUF4352 domain-containing protein n=1 Tax=Paenibacillus sp. 32O-W TaxID=1695218 RepID=UPI000722D93D|nr:DUF4352 domain-containing protein [Paenibacillus sp. 32O-W]ALS27152.1 hypothetical protein IJ21_17510 [Paenibacillus sp. 32O-W]
MKRLLTLTILIAIITGCSSYDNISTQRSQSSQQDSTPNLYEQGASGKIGSFSFSVEKAIETQEYGNKVTENKYVILTVQATNISKEPATVSSNLFVLIDDQDRQYSADNLGILSFDDKSLSFEEINPGLSKTGLLAFEAPKDAKNFILGARDNIFDFGGAEYIFFKLDLEEQHVSE